MRNLLPMILLVVLALSGCPSPQQVVTEDGGVPKPTPPANRYIIYWPVQGGNYHACLETNSYKIIDGNITFRIDGIDAEIRHETIGMVVTLTPPWAITDTQAATAEIPAEVRP